MNREMILEATLYLKPHRDVQMSELNKKYFDLAIEALRAQLNGGWISVDDKLPEHKGSYVVAYHPCYWDDVNNNEVCVGLDSFRGGKNIRNNKVWARNKYQRVTHWRPLPQPPQEV